MGGQGGDQSVVRGVSSVLFPLQARGGAETAILETLRQALGTAQPEQAPVMAVSAGVPVVSNTAGVAPVPLPVAVGVSASPGVAAVGQHSLPGSGMVAGASSSTGAAGVFSAAQSAEKIQGTGAGGGEGAEVVPGSGLGVGNLRILYWIQRSLAPATWLAYQKVWKAWFLFQDDWCAGGLPWVRGEAVICYISELLEKGVSRAGVQRSLAALSFLFKLWGGVDDTQSFMVRQAVKGYVKQGGLPDGRRPVSFNLLHKLLGMLPAVCVSEYERVLFSVVFSWAFFGAFRVGELVSPRKSSPGGIQVHHVVMGMDELRITLVGSKTDKLGKGFLVSLRRLEVQLVCPVAKYEAFVQVRGGAAGSLFIHADGSPLTRYQFVAVFRACIRRLGLREGEYCSHSFRIGAATEAARWGMSENEVKRIGRWESRRFRSYVRMHRVER
ncbi:uncharacterized protein [Engystomops pustulosus]|uniref:uncharacterized protein n=1 Tax=Engystomops pustulosus TaxID=76066 RepID=UPI003AFA929A